MTKLKMIRDQKRGITNQSKHSCSCCFHQSANRLFCNKSFVPGVIVLLIILLLGVQILIYETPSLVSSNYSLRNITVEFSFQIQHSSIKNHSYAFATFVASLSYEPALEVFLYSLSSTHPSYPLIIGIPRIEEYHEIIKTVQRVISKYDGLIDYEISVWPVIPSPIFGEERDRWKINWTKLQLWTMVHYEKLFYIDLDVIIFKNIDDVFFRYSFNQFLGTYDWGRWSPIGKQKMNGGVFLLQPSLQTFHYLYNYREKVRAYRSIEAEQGLFNKVFLQNHCCLPVYYNIQKTVQSHIPVLWHREAIIILHYTGEKPWTSWSATKFKQNYLSNKVKEEQKALDNWDADQYEELHLLWKEYYFKAKHSEFKRLTMYQTYENEKQQKRLTQLPFYRFLRLNESMRPISNDSDATSLYPSLADPLLRDGLGGFSTLNAVYSWLRESPNTTRATTDFIGFTTWKYYVKSEQEGASIDWTKIDFQANTIYFWHGYKLDLHYYNYIEKAHPGILKVIKTILNFPLPSMKFKPYHIKNHSIITSKEIYSNYMESAQQFIETFKRRYVGRKSVACITIYHTIDSCFSFMLEYYFNVWIEYHQFLTIYVVDHPSWRAVNSN